MKFARVVKRVICGFIVMGIFLPGCSSAPTLPPEIRDLRNSVATQLELLNREADRGNYQAALEMMTPTRAMAVAADDPVLLVRTGLAQGNILYFLGRIEESDAALALAVTTAEELGDRELVAISTVYRERQRLLKVLGKNDGAVAAEVRSRVQSEAGSIKTDELAAALAWTVTGLAEKELRRYAEAEAAFKKALDVHSKGRFLEQAAYDWFLIASARSLAGRYADALAALDQALDFDRRAENSHGLGSDWLARGEVCLKMKESANALRAFRRAEAIFASSGAESEARRAAARAETVTETAAQ
jgi:tetratricopeptide (TPR) repeat protein